jgi:hypothetical protein
MTDRKKINSSEEIPKESDRQFLGKKLISMFFNM